VPNVVPRPPRPGPGTACARCLAGTSKPRTGCRSAALVEQVADALARMSEAVASLIYKTRRPDGEADGRHEARR
jgi:hypothetical protein